MKIGFNFYEEASTEIVSNKLIGENPKAYRNRTAFLKGALIASGKSIDELKAARRNGNLDFLREIIPNQFITEIPMLENKLSKNLKNEVEAKKIKEQLDAKLFEYIDYLYDSKKLSKFSDEDQKDIINNIMEASVMGTSYDKAKYERKTFTMSLKNMVNNEIKIDRNNGNINEVNIKDNYINQQK